MAIKVAFVGFRHGHINSLYGLLAGREDAEIVAACEEDAATRAALAESPVAITHDSYEAMLAEVDCDVVACGDYYGIRGERLIAALEAGRHVMADKPLCTRLSELDRIERLAADTGRRVGCMLDLCDAGPFQTLHRLLKEGVAGEVHTIHFDGQHPLNYGTRPGWYFEQGKHGGTINDLAIHAIDAIPWLTGRGVVEVTAARAWNARFLEHPSFQDGAVLMLRLDNGGAVTGDVSYLTPENHGYRMPSYWRFSISGSEGYVETSGHTDTVFVYAKGDDAVRAEPAGPARTAGYWEDYLADVAGRPDPEGLHTERVLRSSRQALAVQRAADSEVYPHRL
ncbi:MAG: Gfo/Idh/MocA family oxidoreductase [Candidatus Hydrogenedentes bacterium]|nr:Gfo/Idh/MocA family oxidoreductase [Candidatus Hydrogenedentota bacterium]